MSIPEHLPCFEGVALRALGSEALKVWILTIMASSTVENFAGGTFFELTGALNREPGLQECERRGAVGIRMRCPLESAGTDTSEFDMIHLEGTEADSLMLEVARRAFANTRVKHGGLTAKQAF